MLERGQVVDLFENYQESKIYCGTGILLEKIYDITMEVSNTTKHIDKVSNNTDNYVVMKDNLHNLYSKKCKNVLKNITDLSDIYIIKANFLEKFCRECVNTYSQTKHCYPNLRIVVNQWKEKLAALEINQQATNNNDIELLKNKKIKELFKLVPVDFIVKYIVETISFALKEKNGENYHIDFENHVSHHTYAVETWKVQMNRDKGLSDYTDRLNWKFTYFTGETKNKKNEKTNELPLSESDRDDD